MYAGIVPTENQIMDIWISENYYLYEPNRLAQEPMKGDL